MKILFKGTERERTLGWVKGREGGANAQKLQNVFKKVRNWKYDDVRRFVGFTEERRATTSVAS